MEIFFLSLLFFSGICLVHTYWFYPKLLRWLADRQPSTPPGPPETMPFVSVLMAVYNEEKVIARKIDTLLRLNYPADQIRIFIGSDHSSDGTNDILETYQQRDPRIRFHAFSERNGKPGIINRLYEEAIRFEPASKDHLLLITDANVMLEPDCLYSLARHFQDPEIAIVDAHMQHVGLQAEGISRSEDQYLSGEVQLKHHEGKLWGTMIGPFGGCYTLRSDYFSPVPSNFLVDDFYIAMRVFERGGRAINDLEAVCVEAVSHEWREEYRRKARISTGNYQNLVTFRHLWWPPFRPLSFAFLSHKVLRWLGPFFLILFFAASLALWLLFDNYYYSWLFLCVIVFYFALPILDILLRRGGIQWRFIRNIRYFFLMNLALLTGFFRFIKGVNNNVWEPPKRQQLPS
ncbi:glycosyltransferase [Flavilitoribacter nigricans]|uniref:Glycosyl transferase family 2 n=1 Tax=Flavilitoribacter nigricans (strain ATCC 23147 / DSM 23189 / NBRC 102662 / NCIMB 1420 / SS-2) TaxID=1122177 RepID=A0A2D0NDP4_FLAN2|nr:glycosyltransferase [Flavilitoribacter nigricans]PHN06597.1 glycosyl transferase family 2 [Flavilitoribacter nigricans DSM 23189 = NBRC 102662]